MINKKIIIIIKIKNKKLILKKEQKINSKIK
jgi:hypothetical protein